MSAKTVTEGSVLVSPKTNHAYTLAKQLGKGSFGTVFKGIGDVGDVAVKVMYLPENAEERNSVLRDFEREVAAQEYLSVQPQCQTNIVCLYEYWVDEDNNAAILISELMDGDLDHLPPSDEEFVPMTRQLLEGLNFIHNKNFVHRDIKQGNVLRKGHMFKLADLGLLCGSANNKPLPLCSYGAGTLVYLAPEVFQAMGLNSFPEEMKPSDVWALGVTIFELLHNELPFRDISEFVNEESFKKYMRNLPQSDIDAAFDQLQIGDEVFDNLDSVLYGMLKVDPNERLTAKEALDLLDELIPLDDGDDEMMTNLETQEVLRIAEAAALQPENEEMYFDRINEAVGEGRVSFDQLQDVINMLEKDLAIRRGFYDQETIIAFDERVLPILRSIVNVQ